MRNLGINAPDGTAAKVADIKPVITKLVLVQNNDPANDMRVGFTEASTTITDGFRVGPGELLPIPLNGNVGAIWVLGDGGIVPGVLGLL